MRMHQQIMHLTSVDKVLGDKSKIFTSAFLSTKTKIKVEPEKCRNQSLFVFPGPPTLLKFMNHLKRPSRPMATTLFLSHFHQLEEIQLRMTLPRMLLQLEVR